MFLLLIIWAAFGLWGYAVGAKKDKAVLGLALGFFLGIIGVLIIYFIKGDKATASLRNEVDQTKLMVDRARLRNELSQLEQTHYDNAMKSSNESS